MATEGPAARRGLFGRRKGRKLRPHESNLLERLLPTLALDLNHPAPDRPEALFAVPVDDLRLEIGFGSGEHLISEAVRHARTGFLGCEPFINGMARALSAIADKGIGNVRLHPGDALDLIEWLPDASLAVVDMLYPDPWPKRRHWKRRFVTDTRIRQIARVLRSDGLFRFATDSSDYAAWTLLRFMRASSFVWTAEHADDWRRPWLGFAGTRYEAKAKREGRAPCYLVFRRI